ILQLSCDRNRLARREYRADAISRFRGSYRDILRDTELALEHPLFFLDRLQVKDRRCRVNRRCGLDSSGWVQDKLNRLVARHSGRIDVDTWWKLDLSGQGDAAPRDHGAIGLRQGEPKMRRSDILAHFFGQFREKLPNDVVRRESIRVLGLKILVTDDALRVDIEES